MWQTAANGIIKKSVLSGMTKEFSAYRDAQGFRRGLKKINVKPVDAMVYHYGWVKNPKKMKEKLKKIQELWVDTIYDPT